MGIDAEMFVTWDEPLGEPEIRQLGWALAEAYGRDRFGITEEYGAVARYEHNFDGVLPFDKPTVLHVNTWDRYYGNGYERGPIYLAISMAEWFEHRLPGCAVWYGGDSGVGVHLFGKKQRAAIFEHFAQVGHQPYRLGNDGDAPDCPFCLNQTVVYRWHGLTGERTSSCSGCGREASFNPESGWSKPTWKEKVR